jgi:hypothetical protein
MKQDLAPVKATTLGAAEDVTPDLVVQTFE